MSPATHREREASKVKLIGLVVLGGIVGVVDLIVLMLTGVPA